MAPEREKRKALILCTGNSCRSQLAEALINDRYGDNWQAFSAGTHPAGYVHACARQVLAEIGIHHQGKSKHLDEFYGQAFDLVVTVCDSAAEECPVWLGSGLKIHHSFPDPAQATGSEAEIMDAFRQVRDELVRQIPNWLAQVV